MKVSEHIKELRYRTGLSQQKFGMLFKISAINVANWEQGVTIPPEYVVYMIERLLELDTTLPKRTDKKGKRGEVE